MDLVEGCPVLECALELLKIQKFGHVHFCAIVAISSASFHGSDPLNYINCPSLVPRPHPLGTKL